MAKDTSGWVKIYRKIIESDGYFSEPFCRNMAWVDLILLANRVDNFYRVRGIRVDIKRGQVGYGLDTLSARWQWSRGKVERFLKELEKEEKIVRQKNNITTLISLVNYDEYQSNDKAGSKANGQQVVKQTDMNKKDKNVEKDKKDDTAAEPPTFKKLGEKEFYDSIAFFKEKYPKEILRAFFNYWSEKDEKGNMRFQLQKTWEIKKRLTTWSNKNFNNGSGKANSNSQSSATARSVESLLSGLD